MKHYKLIAGVLFVLLLSGILSTVPLSTPGDRVIFAFYFVGITIASLLGAAGIGSVLDKSGGRRR